ncbi:peptidyl-prolyl cis-trans isomerase [Paenibacillus physcomitrellae]|uniref:PpiC domain-containing protein n=1 Tax=Paenibacillus physcomitrellae TaxID=1619311 RepID=A0ABQ1FR53_9BACL|nr:peptidylprolyl isomerase [Paenibacillus physcomitrellae]GGA26465.1 hypothetical protein GCM10010917_09090 [Paenibacillus physcomitrellae]
MNLKRQSRRGKRRLMLAAAVILLAAAGGTAAALSPALTGWASSEKPAGAAAAAPGEDAVILTVDGEPVTAQEYRLLMNREKSAVTNAFNAKYGAEDQPDYWTHDFGGESPLQALKQRTDKAAAESKTIQRLAREQGLIGDISFSRLLADWQTLNRQRSQNLQTNQPVYGLTSFTLDQYYDYYMNHLKQQLQEKLGDNTLKPAEQDIKTYYDAHPQLFQSRDEYDVQLISIPYGEADKTAALQEANRVLQSLDAGKSPAEAALQAKDAAFSKQTLKAASASEASGSSDPSAPAPESSSGGSGIIFQTKDILSAAAAKMQAGQHSSVLDDGSAYILLQLDSVRRNQPTPLEEVQDQIQEQLLRDHFDAYIRSAVQAAKVNIQPTSYDAISL